MLTSKKIPFRGFTITTGRLSGLFYAQAKKNSIYISKMYGLTKQDAINCCQLEIIKYFSSTCVNPCIMACGDQVLKINLAGNILLENYSSKNLGDVISELLKRRGCTIIETELMMSDPDVIMYKFC